MKLETLQAFLAFPLKPMTAVHREGFYDQADDALIGESDDGTKVIIYSPSTNNLYLSWSEEGGDDFLELSLETE